MKISRKYILYKGIAYLMAFFLAMPSMLNIASVIEAGEADIKYGDINADSLVNASDALLGLQHAAKLITLNETEIKAANVSGGEVIVNANDALLILKFAAKIIDVFPVEIEGIKPTETEIMPTETTAPTETGNLGPDKTDVPDITVIPTLPPTPSPSPSPEAPVPTHITVVNAKEYAVEGTPVNIKNLNGAKQYNEDENGTIFTFTDENRAKRTGIQIENPIKNNQDMIQSYAYVRELEDPEGKGRTNVFDLSGSRLGWGNDEDKLPLPESQLFEDPEKTLDNRAWHTAKEDEIYYPLARGNKGFSMSFWSKSNKDEDISALLVFANANQTTSISVNATARYNDAELSDNYFSTSQHANDPNYVTGKWHYYTVTFANDWICVYIDGVEVKYDEIELSRKNIRSFNDGFLTRYNTAISWEEEDYNNDWRGYLRKQHIEADPEGYTGLYDTITSDNYTVFGNGRYRGLGAQARLMLTFMAGETTEVYIGGTQVEAGEASAK